jgi:murein endopeptidase
MYRKRIKLHAKFDVKIKSKIRCQNKEQCNARQGCDKFLFAAIEEKKYQTKIYKNAMEMYRKRLKIKTSK